MSYTNLLSSFIKSGVQRSYKKGEFIIQEGEIENHLYYIETGAVRAFLVTSLEEQTIRFGYEGSFINSLHSFLKRTPSEFYIEAMRNTSVLQIPREKISSCIHESAESLKEYVALLEANIVGQIEREIDLLTVSPADRLARVLKRSPNLFQEIPLKYIASYLRMTPETLSRIRSS
jgi:CRP/FNR family transcriptional regulator, anaerobic regulatory protein